MTIDLKGTRTPLSQFSDFATNDKSSCWQRLVKRKYNDASGKLQFYTHGKTEAINDRVLCQVPWDTMPGSIVCEETSCHTRMLPLRDSNILFEDKNFDSCCLEHCGQSSDSRAVRRDAISKKRVHVATSSETPRGADQIRHNTVESEVSMLRKVLKNERDFLRKLRRELEEERSASAAAANEAMAMITRLQEQKAAALVESRRYRQAAEEREMFNEEAIALLKEALIRKEYELLALQKNFEAYRNMIMKLESEQGLNKSDCLEAGEDKEQVLFLEGQSCMGSKRFICHSVNEFTIPESYMSKETYGQCGEFENLELFMGNQNSRKGKERNLVGGSAEINYDAGERAFQDPIFNSYFLAEHVSSPQNQFQEMESDGMHDDKHNLHMEAQETCEEQDLEDETESILARVVRLEERFACLGPYPALECETLTLLYQNTEESIDDLEHQGSTRLEDWEQASISFWSNQKSDGKEVKEDSISLTSGRVTQALLHGKDKELEGLQVAACERVLNVEATKEKEPKMSRRNSTAYMMNLPKGLEGEEHSLMEPGADNTEEAVHDIYEVQCDMTSSSVHNSGRVMGRCQSAGTLEVYENQAMEGTLGKHVPSFSNSLTKEEPAVEMSSMDVQSLERHVADNDVRQLKGRLQALEGERVFMREAIEALRKENMELKLLQEIAEGLRELKGDVWRTEKAKVAGQQNLLPFFSFLKGIFPFIGNCLANKENIRSLYACQERSRFNSSTQEQRGLCHLLNRCSQSEKSLCVTREHIVRFGNA